MIISNYGFVSSLNEMESKSVSLGAREISRLIWNFELQDVERILDKDGLEHISLARIKLLKAEIYAIRAFIGEKADDFNTSHALLDEAFQSSQVHLFSQSGSMMRWLGSSKDVEIENPILLDNSLVHAQSELFKSLLCFRQAHFIRGSWLLRKAWKQYRRLHDYIEKAGDATTLMECRGGYGSFLFCVSLVPKFLQSFLSGLGFVSDHEKGLQMMYECAEGSSSMSSVIGVLLLLIELSVFEDVDKAEKTYLALVERIGKSPVVHYIGGYIARKGHNIPLAMERFALASLNGTNMKIFQTLAIYEKGWCFFIRNDWKHCVEHLELFLEKHDSPSAAAFANYQLGYALCMLERQEEALKVLQRTQSLARSNYSYDRFALRKSEQFISNGGLSEVQKKIIVANNTMLLGEFREALSQFESIEGCMKDAHDDATAETWYLRAMTLRKLNKLDESFGVFEQVLLLKDRIEEEIYLIPHSLCEKGEILLIVDESEDVLRNAEIIFKQADAYSQYDFDKPLHRRIARNLRYIDKLRHQ